MSVGIIGAARMGQLLARVAAASGHQVVLSNRRGPKTLEDVAASIGPAVRAGTVADACACDLVCLATPWWALDALLPSLPSLRGKTVIDATNAFASYAPFTPADLGGAVSSEIVAGRVPGGHVVKAFNTLPAEAFAASRGGGCERTVLFLSGDHEPSKAIIGAMAEAFGLAAIDLGTLSIGGRLQQAGGPLAGKHFRLAA